MKSFKQFISEGSPQLGRVKIVYDLEKKIPSSEEDKRAFERMVMQTGEYAQKNEKGERVYDEDMTGAFSSKPEWVQDAEKEAEEEKFKEELKNQPKFAGMGKEKKIS